MKLRKKQLWCTYASSLTSPVPEYEPGRFSLDQPSPIDRTYFKDESLVVSLLVFEKLISISTFGSTAA